MAAISRFTIRTSTRRVMRRCLRKWGYQSSMRMNLERKGTETNINFWFGSAIHFAMEDYFGYNRFGDPVKAFQGYYAAFPAYDRPEGADQMYYIGLGMLEYFKEWYPKHNEAPGFETVWLDVDGVEVLPGTQGAKPLIEESFMLDMGMKVWVREDTEQIVFDTEAKLRHALTAGRVRKDFQADRYYMVEPVPDSFPPIEKHIYLIETPVYYHGTLDRIVKDRQGRWWILDWKTAKGADTNKLDTDDQISAYLWAAEQWFGHPIHGFVYVQLTKDVARPLKVLANGNLSVDKKQKTTYTTARKSVISTYGSVTKAPANVVTYLNWLLTEESPEGDKFLRWDMVTRTPEQKVSTYNHIVGELRLMLDPDLYLFPNPTRDCIWDCNFREACLMTERGKEQDALRWLHAEFQERPREEDGNTDKWKENVPWPDTPQGAAIGTLLAQLELSASQTLNVLLPDKYLVGEDE